MNRPTLENMTYEEFCQYIESTYGILKSNRPTMRTMILDLIDYYENKIEMINQHLDTQRKS